MRLIVAMLSVVCALLMTGCIPERVVWSPDGTQAAVLGDDGLHVCDADGKIGPVLVPEVSRVAWLPDGKHVVVVRATHFTTFAEYMKMGGHGGVAAEVQGKVRAILVASNGDWNKVEEGLKPLQADEVRQALMYFRETAGALPENVLRDAWPHLVDLTYDPPVVQVYEVTAEGAKAGPVSVQGRMDTMMEIRVSPDGKWVAATMTATKQDDKAPPLLVVSKVFFEPQDDVMVVGASNSYVDWSMDSQAVVYMRPHVTEGDVKLGTLSRQVVVNGEGKLFMAAETGDGKGREDLAGLVFNNEGRVRVAADGRIYFIAMDIQLPAAPADIAPEPVLFCVQPGVQATVTRVMPRSVRLPADAQLAYFSVSPDGKHLAIPANDGRVAVVTIGTGEVMNVQEVGITTKQKLTSVPTWRSADELTFVRPVAEGVNEVVRYSISEKKAVVMSGTWEGGVKQNWLLGEAEKKEEVVPKVP